MSARHIIESAISSEIEIRRLPSDPSGELQVYKAFDIVNDVEIGGACFRKRDFTVPATPGYKARVIKDLHPCGVRVEPEWRRKGIATALYRRALNDNPGFEMGDAGPGARSRDGTAFRRAFDKTSK